MNNKWIGISALALTLAAGAVFQLTNRTETSSSDQMISTADSTEIEKQKEVFLYGINVTGLNIVEGTVSKNQTLASILSPFNVPYQIIDEIAKKSKGIFDVRGIAADKKFTVISPSDSEKPQFFIYEPNPAEYVVFDLDSLDIYKAEKPAEYRTKEIGGVIERSLYVDMVSRNVSLKVINKFADLFGWSVDFQALQKGDVFKVVYQEKVVDDVVVGVSDIQLAYFQHNGKTFHAIPFEQDGVVNFFDQDGNSLKKAFLRDPLEYTRISSRYNLKRFHPVQKRVKPHLGTDYAAKTGTEIRSVGNGTVVEAKFTSANGNYVKIKHNGTYTTQYLHMSKIGKGIKPGTKVSQGQVIGYVGSTGLATGPHLCFRFWKNGKQEDWLAEEIPPSEPISKANLAAFNVKKAESLTLLAQIPTDADRRMLAALSDSLSVQGL
jgi:murein DD-endopeptidase MepM/ murein hydrolase activator NlpD